MYPLPNMYPLSNIYLQLSNMYLKFSNMYLYHNISKLYQNISIFSPRVQLFSKLIFINHMKSNSFSQKTSLQMFDSVHKCEALAKSIFFLLFHRNCISCLIRNLSCEKTFRRCTEELTILRQSIVQN